LYSMRRCANFAKVTITGHMKNTMMMTALLALLAGCATQAPLKVRVTPLGEEPQEVKARYLYALPMNVLKVEVTYREVRSIPGPYSEYAERYLGLEEVIRQKSSQWQIQEVHISPHLEMDPEHYYSLNVLEGHLDPGWMEGMIEKQMLLDGSLLVQEGMPTAGSDVFREQYLPFVDLGVTGNFEERTETMYKTLVTDTSFVQVPVERSVVEQKSISKKAEEAADFLLEVRTRRFEMLTGEYEVFPDGEAMEATIRKLDQLEASYLSLFTGKSIVKTMKKSWFIIPGSGSGSSGYPLAMFSEQFGFVPSDLMEGSLLEVRLEPTGTTAQPARVASSYGRSLENALFYRLPEVVDVKVMWAEQLLYEQRLSIYQAGALATYPVSE
jgi:hypothetical protein